MRTFELWSDSFHEGQWACEQLALTHIQAGGTHSYSFVDGFLPVHTYSGPASFEIVVYGDYDAWESRPEKISELVPWGKPDLALYDASSDRILFAVEETAATPTGNQAMQRCERQYGAMRLGIPFWYLLSEFGMHLDGGVRHDSIWPTITALKLTQDRRVPSVVLHYSDLTSPEDYSAGTGLRSLFQTLHRLILDSVGASSVEASLQALLTEQYDEMLKFIDRQWRSQIEYLPGSPALADADLPAQYAAAALGHPEAEEAIWDKAFLRWPLLSSGDHPLREGVAEKVTTDDVLAQQIEKDVAEGLAYPVMKGRGSKPQPPADLEVWLTAHRTSHQRMPALDPAVRWTLSMDDFQNSPTGRKHVTRSRHIAYLYDSWGDFSQSLQTTFPRLSEKLDGLVFAEEDPVFVYLSSSVKPGRIFGDPFTGQLAAWATAFGKFDQRPRRVVAYYPHQSHAQIRALRAARPNKGVTIMKELTDLIIFAGGVAVLPTTGVTL
ncbi:hypothetical protein O2W14_07030 [Modestobacter sp. VKM Ac-2986]|uniref:hypothetical protein n=1 Tax=Modestobacter sp. VKM Ac-2986 TaxID=3004140 RepID=UPI0022AAA57B|nr:hypothetical protein [Modestobacter sp. VKM Ac-2986]MCZ2828581.1 hypothetical protein [Modestobacter sp. VKM Ac-2986]